MKKVELKIFFIFLFWPGLVSAHNKSLYGPDDRVLYTDLFRSEHNRPFLQKALSVAALVPHFMLSLNSNSSRGGSCTISPQDTGVCSELYFSKIKSAATCSAFLVAPKTLMTAAHCLTSDWSQLKVVFDFIYGLGPSSVRFVYSIDRVQFLNTLKGEESDVAFIFLNQNPPFQPLKLAKDWQPQKSVLMIGHPLGMPKTLTFNGTIKNWDEEGFYNDLDAFSGNSGSPILRYPDLQVIGVHSEGLNGLWWNQVRGCYEYNECADGQCIYSHAVRVDSLKMY